MAVFRTVQSAFRSPAFVRVSLSLLMLGPSLGFWFGSSSDTSLLSNIASSVDFGKTLLYRLYCHLKRIGDNLDYRSVPYMPKAEDLRWISDQAPFELSIAWQYRGKLPTLGIVQSCFKQLLLSFLSFPFNKGRQTYIGTGSR